MTHMIGGGVKHRTLAHTASKKTKLFETRANKRWGVPVGPGGWRGARQAAESPSPPLHQHWGYPHPGAVQRRARGQTSEQVGSASLLRSRISPSSIPLGFVRNFTSTLTINGRHPNTLLAQGEVLSHLQRQGNVNLEISPYYGAPCPPRKARLECWRTLQSSWEASS